jgi:hypothetical protein
LRAAEYGDGAHHSRQVTPALTQSRIIDRHATTEINPDCEQPNTATAPTMATLTGDTETNSLYSQISAQMMGQRSKRLLIVDDDARVCRLVNFGPTSSSWIFRWVSPTAWSYCATSRISMPMRPSCS